MRSDDGNKYDRKFFGICLFDYGSCMGDQFIIYNYQILDKMVERMVGRGEGGGGLKICMKLLKNM